MSLRGHSQLPLEGDVDWERFLGSGRKEMSQLCSREVRRRIWGNTAWSPSPQSMEGAAANPPGNHFQTY